jgi:hypothetical protein
MGGACGTNGAEYVQSFGMTIRRKVYRVLVGKSEAKRRLVKPRCRWKSIKMDFREMQEI